MTTPHPPIVLASGSPRRRGLLAGLGLPFAVVTSGVDEEFAPGTPPDELVVELAERKARAVAALRPDAVVIGGDTTVAIDGEILNKPTDDADARRMLRLLRGRAHVVWTGLALVGPGGRVTRSAVGSIVYMRAYDDAAIDAYVATGEPLDKAGAYAIQGGAGVFVARIAGCYANVVGLPLCELAARLGRIGLAVPAAEPVCRLADGRACPRLEPGQDEPVRGCVHGRPSSADG